MFAVHGDLFGIELNVRDAVARFEIDLLSPGLNRNVDVPGNLSAHDCADETHQAVRLSQISAADGLDHDQETIVN
ncbi:MAG: hypothetical protein M3Z85_20110, partial [Acidobacteriota bacterium]|nr:hypothetical protein [Acidobacteriota bacterium]